MSPSSSSESSSWSAISTSAEDGILVTFSGSVLELIYSGSFAISFSVDVLLTSFAISFARFAISLLGSNSVFSFLLSSYEFWRAVSNFFSF